MKKKISASKAINIRPFSSILVDGPERAAARAMLYPVGFTEEDFKKPIIGIASTWSNVTPCNMHIDKLALESEKGANAAGGKAIVFNTITISDGISMGSEGMKYSLVSREVIADSIETVVGCAGMDGYVAIGGCDKNMPGAMICIARMNRAAVFVYGGTILPGCITGDKLQRKLDVVSVFEAVGQHAAGKLDDKGLHEIETCAIPGAGSCGAVGQTHAERFNCAGHGVRRIHAAAAHDGFDGVGDDFARDERILHAFTAHRDAVGNGVAENFDTSPSIPLPTLQRHTSSGCATFSPSDAE